MPFYTNFRQIVNTPSLFLGLALSAYSEQSFMKILGYLLMKKYSVFLRQAQA